MTLTPQPKQEGEKEYEIEGQRQADYNQGYKEGRVEGLRKLVLNAIGDTLDELPMSEVGRATDEVVERLQPFLHQARLSVRRECKKRIAKLPVFTERIDQEKEYLGYDKGYNNCRKDAITALRSREGKEV